MTLLEEEVVEILAARLMAGDNHYPHIAITDTDWNDLGELTVSFSTGQTFRMVPHDITNEE